MKFENMPARKINEQKPASSGHLSSRMLPLVACAAFLAFSGCAASSSIGNAANDPKIASQMLLDGKNKSDYEKFVLARAIYRKENAGEALRVLLGIERMRDFPDKAIMELERAVRQYGNFAQKLRLEAWYALMILREGCTFEEENACILAIVKSGDAQIALKALRQVCRPSSRKALERVVEKGAKKTAP